MCPIEPCPNKPCAIFRVYLLRVHLLRVQLYCVRLKASRDGDWHERGIHCGVPQGSVLGPLLWDLAYDRVLCLPLPTGCHAICYADNTLVVAVGDSWGNAAARAETAVARVVGEISGMGLQVAVQKKRRLCSSAAGPPEHRRRHVSGSVAPPSWWETDSNSTVSYWTECGRLGIILMPLPPGWKESRQR